MVNRQRGGVRREDFSAYLLCISSNSYAEIIAKSNAAFPTGLRFVSILSPSDPVFSPTTLPSAFFHLLVNEVLSLVSACNAPSLFRLVATPLTQSPRAGRVILAKLPGRLQQQ